MSPHAEGSSPRMRGARQPDVRGDRWRGIIPAYAGSTPVCRRWLGGARDHPRVCGEHSMADCDELLNGGSSPRMRGARRDGLQHARRRGIIPAYAGGTLRSHRSFLLQWDHPRVCGEHSSFTPSVYWLLGSSPRMRGAHLHALGISEHIGIIPAYAGSTDFLSVRLP